GVDVARRADRKPHHLLRARVVRRHHTEQGLRDCPLLTAAVGPYQLGDAEIEELWDPFFCDQNVAGLQIAVDNQVLVSVLHGFTNEPEHLQSFDYGEIVVSTIPGDPQTVNEFQHEVGEAAVGCSPVEEPGDKRVLEVGEYLPFLPETDQHGIGVHASFHEFEGDFLLKMIVIPYCEVDSSHSTAAQEPNHTIGSDALSGIVNFLPGRRGVGAVRLQERVLKQGRFGLIASQQRVQFSSKRFIAAAGFLEELLTVAWQKLSSLQEQSLDLAPTFGCHVAALWDSSPSIARRSQASATRVSRMTVTVAIPRASAVSSTVQPPK